MSSTVFAASCFVLLLGFASCKSVKWTDCGSQNGEVKEVFITPCDSEPCTFQIGQSINVEFDFTSKIKSDNGTLGVTAFLFGSKISVPPPVSDVCQLSAVSCPLKPDGTVYKVSEDAQIPYFPFPSDLKTRIELLENQMKRYNWEQAQLQHMKDYVARFGHGSAKLARQAQSKEKTMAKMIAGGLTEKAVQETVKQFYFFDAGEIPPPVIMVQHVSFRYNETTPWIYKDIDFGIDLDTRIALVGPNGAGKSTLLKLLCADVMPTDGLIRRHSHVKIGRYHQHLHEELPLEKSALEFMMSSFPEVKEKEEMRKIVGRYGITGREQVCPMKQLSDGQRCRVSFAWLAWQQPHLLLLDEPTNHLDMESIDALAEAINCFPGGMILVSHDFRLVSQVAEEVWVCDNQNITKWDGDIFSFKTYLRQQIDKEVTAREKGVVRER